MDGMSMTGELGAAGEELAVGWLRAHGFLIMDRNWRMGRYELDIVAARGERVHFVEVKLRRAGGLTQPEEAMTAAKGRALLSDRSGGGGPYAGRERTGAVCAGCRAAQVVGLSVRAKFYTFVPCGPRRCRTATK